MEFNPDAYLQGTQTASTGFDPDSYLGKPSEKPPVSTLEAEKKAAAKGQVYVEPTFGLSAKGTAELFSFAERASATIRGAAQLLGIRKDETAEEVVKREALEKSKQYGKASTIAGVAGAIADPITYLLPLGKATTMAQFVKQSAAAGGVGGLLSATAEEGTRIKSAAHGAAFGAAGGALLGTVLRAGGKLFGKDFLPWKATEDQKKKVIEEVFAENPELSKEEAEKVRHFFDAPQDKQINAQKTAEKLLTENASAAKVEKASKNPLVKQYLDEYEARYKSLQEAFDATEGKVAAREEAIAKEQEKTADALKEQQALKEAGEARTVQPETPKKEPTYPMLGLDKYGRPPSKGQAGIVSPKLVANIAGAGLGAVLDPEDPLTGAVLGVAAVHGGWKALEMVTARDANKVAKEIAPDVFASSRKIIGQSVNEINKRSRDNFVLSSHAASLLKTDEAKEKVSHALEGTVPLNSLSNEEMAAYKELKEGFDRKGKEAVEAGVVKEMRSNYVTHLIDHEKSNPTAVREFVDHILSSSEFIRGAGALSSKFSKRREYETIKQAEAQGIVFKTKDATQLYKILADSLDKAIVGKGLMKHLTTEKLSTGQVAAVRLTEKKGVPFGWKTNSSLPGYAIHPDIAPILEHMFTSYSPGAVMRTLSAVTNAVKRINVLGTFFHAWNLYGSMLLSAPKLAIKQLNPLDPFGGVRRATEMFRQGKMGDQVSEALGNGLSLDIPIDVDKQVFSHIGNVVDHASSKLGFSTGIEKVAKGFEKVAIGIPDKVTWDFMHTGGKLMIYQHLLDNAKMKNPEMDEKALGKEIADFVNGAFGGLNWTQIAADTSNTLIHDLTNPRSRATMALAMFAPDWTLSTVATSLRGLKPEGGIKGVLNPTTATDLSRRYMLNTAIAYLTLFEGINLMTSGKHIWENKDPTRIEFKDGTSMQIAKHAMEPYEWAMHPEKTLANKMAFLPRSAIIYWGEKQYPFGPELEDKTPLGKLKQIGKGVLPFQVSSGMSAPEGEGLKRALISTLGIPIYGMNVQQKAQVRMERKKARLEKTMEIRRKMSER